VRRSSVAEPEVVLPIERRDATTQVRAVIIAVASLVLAGVLGFMAIRSFSKHGGSVVKAADVGSTFSLDAAAVSAEIAKDGPVLFPDAGTGGQRRPIFVYHQGADIKVGWRVYVALPPGAAAGCFLRWDAAAERLRAPCSNDTFAPTGEGLTTLPTSVTDDGRLVVELSPPPATTTSVRSG
jgi:hypothetical protein